MEEKVKKFLFAAGGSYRPKVELRIDTLASSHRVQQITLYNWTIYLSTPGLLFCFSTLAYQTKEEILEKLSEEIFFDRNLF